MHRKTPVEGAFLKALVLSGGKGTRLRPHTHTTAKQLVPVANRPILGYVLEHIGRAGIKEAGIIVSEGTSGQVKQYVKDGAEWGFERVLFILQEPLGLAHAVATARDFLGDSDFVMYLGDNLLQKGLGDAIKRFKNEKLDALISLKTVQNPENFGVAEIGPDAEILRLVEKPRTFVSDMALVGVYVFSPKIHKAMEGLKPSWRGEYEITDAITRMIEMGMNVKAEVIEGWWLDTGKKDSLLEANTAVLDEYVELRLSGIVEEGSKITGRVTVEEGAEVLGSTIRGPAIIGRGSKIIRSFIGPFTSIGEEVRVSDSAIQHSVVLQSAEILNVDRIEDSVIGKFVKIKKDKAQHRAYRLSVGDYSTLEL